jgi:hypothetical protein
MVSPWSKRARYESLIRTRFLYKKILIMATVDILSEPGPKEKCMASSIRVLVVDDQETVLLNTAAFWEYPDSILPWGPAGAN